MTAGAGDLTRNQRLVLAALERAGAPRSAYALLDELRAEGLRAPQQIYRALAQLTESGRVHRLEAINAFVACSHPGAHGHGEVAAQASVFLVCRACEGADEATDPAVTAALARLCEAQDFAAEKRTVELYGLCRACRAAGNA